MDSHQEACSEPAGFLHAAFQDSPWSAGVFKAVARVESALIEAPDGPLLVSGLHGGAGAMLLAGWFQQQGKPGMVVTPDRESADQLAGAITTYGYQAVSNTTAQVATKHPGNPRRHPSIVLERLDLAR